MPLGEPIPHAFASSSHQGLGRPQILIHMSSQAVDISLEASTPMEVPSGAGAQDNKSGLDDYQVARSLIQSILLPIDVETMDCEGGDFWVWDSYNSILRLSDNPLFLDLFSRIFWWH